MNSFYLHLYQFNVTVSHSAKDTPPLVSRRQLCGTVRVAPACQTFKKEDELKSVFPERQLLFLFTYYHIQRAFQRQSA